MADTGRTDTIMGQNIMEEGLRCRMDLDFSIVEEDSISQESTKIHYSEMLL